MSRSTLQLMSLVAFGLTRFLAIWAKPSPGCLRVSIQLYWVQQWRRS